MNSSGELVFQWYLGWFYLGHFQRCGAGIAAGGVPAGCRGRHRGSVTFYVNGALVSSSSSTLISSDYFGASGNLEVGGLSQGPNLFNGLIDDVSVTLALLPPDEIARIYANGGVGTDLGGSGTEDATVEGNLIGTNAAGTGAIGNGVGRCRRSPAAPSSNTIGGTVAGAGNVISGNVNDGVELSGSGTSGNVIAGNNIGTNAAGTAAIANGSGAEVLNGQSGIEIDTNASGNLIGGTVALARNLVSGNTDYGIAIDVGSSRQHRGRQLMSAPM